MRLSPLKLFLELTRSFTDFIVRFDDFFKLNEKWYSLLERMRDRGYVGVILAVPAVVKDDKKSIEYLRDLEADGWEIAQHGFSHDALAFVPRLVDNVKSKSEFAGIPYEKQYERIKKGKEILESFGLRITTFAAPWHAFDINTLEALVRLNFGQVSDGHFIVPKFYKNRLLLIPVIYWRVHKFFMGSATLCVHLGDIHDVGAFVDSLEYVKEYLTTCYKVGIKWRKNPRTVLRITLNSMYPPLAKTYRFLRKVFS